MFQEEVQRACIQAKPRDWFMTELDLLYPVSLTASLARSQGPKRSLKPCKESTVQDLQKSLQLLSEIVPAKFLRHFSSKFFSSCLPSFLCSFDPSFLPSFILSFISAYIFIFCPFFPLFFHGIQSVLHIHGFFIPRFNWPQIKNTQKKKNSRKFQKTKLDFAAFWQLSTYIYIVFTMIYTEFILY